MGRTWPIFGRICLPCGRNLSSVDIAKCDPKFSSWNYSHSIDIIVNKRARECIAPEKTSRDVSETFTLKSSFFDDSKDY